MIYILHIQHQRCARCGASESLSTLYQAEELPRPGRSHKLLPCHSIGPLDAVHRVELPHRTTAICAACPAPESFAIGSQRYAEWQETLKRKSAEFQRSADAAIRAATRPNQPKTSPKKATLEDLA